MTMNTNKKASDAKASTFWPTAKRLLGYFKPYRKKVILMFLFAALGVAFLITGPRLLGHSTDIIIQGIVYDSAGNVADAHVNFQALKVNLAVLLIVYGLSALFTYLQQRTTAQVAQRTIYDLREDVDKKIQRLPLNYYDTHTHGDILSRTTTDIEQISTTIQQMLVQFITAAFTIIGIVIMMFTISWQMSIIALCVLPAALFLCSIVIRKSQKYFLGQQDKLGTVNSYVEEQYSGHTVIKLYGTEERTEDAFDAMSDALNEDARRAQFASSIMMPVTNLVGNIGYVGICVLGGIMTSNGNLTIGAIQSFIQYTQQFTQPIIQTSNILNLLQSTIAAAERVFDLLDDPEQSPERENLQVIDRAKGDIEFDHVRFGYSADKILITDMNAKIQQGQKVGICGPTGAGKTTLVNLLMRFYDISGGSIKIDGIDTRDMSRQNVRRLFGMVLQDTWLYSASIRDNIRYGRPEATDQEVEEACKMANADYFISTLPEGYDTPIDESASNLSAGQKQLLTIARAFCADPQILILDEATSSVDTRTEKLIAEAMERLTKGRTNFQIAHRLSTIRDADLILVMKDGDIVEQGNHDQLMERDGVYAGLYNSQFA